MSRQILLVSPSLLFREQDCMKIASYRSLQMTDLKSIIDLKNKWIVSIIYEVSNQKIYAK